MPFFSAPEAFPFLVLLLTPVLSVPPLLPQVSSLLDRDPSRRPGAVLVARVSSAHTASSLEDFLGVDVRDGNKLGGVARLVEDVADVRAALDALACSPGVTHVRMTQKIEDPEAFGVTVARAVADVKGDATGKATLVELVREGEDDADVSEAKVLDSVQHARVAMGGNPLVVLLVEDANASEETVMSVKRRRLQQETNENVYSNGNATTVADKTSNFRDATTMAVVFGILLVIAVCGILATATMEFPSDSLLYPREKND